MISVNTVMTFSCHVFVWSHSWEFLTLSSPEMIKRNTEFFYRYYIFLVADALEYVYM